MRAHLLKLLYRSTLPTILGIGLLLSAPGCKRKTEEIRSYDVPKDKSLAASATPAKPLVADDHEGEAPKWKLPAGWQQLPGGSVTTAGITITRHAVLRPVADRTDLDIPVARFPNQDLVGNINRWAGQVGLPELAPEEVPAKIRTLALGDATARVVDFSGPGKGAGPQRILAALVEHGQDVWSFRLIGPTDAVSPHKAAFDELIASITFHGSAEAPAKPELAGPPAPSAQNPAASATDNVPGIAYDLPAGWTLGPAMPQRIATIQAGPAANGKATEVVVSRLGPQFGSWQENVNRWAREAAITPPTVADDNVPRVTIGGAQVEFIELTGTATSLQVAVYRRPEVTWFFKLRGSPEAVDAQKAAFKAFLGSLKFKD